MEKEPHIPEDDLADHEKDLYADDIKHMHKTLGLMLHEHRDKFVRNVSTQLLLKDEFNGETYRLVMLDEVAPKGTNKSTSSDMVTLYRDYSEDGKKLQESWVVDGDGESVSNWVHLSSPEERGPIHKRPLGPATAEEVHRMAVYIDQIKAHLDSAPQV